jgi:heat shock protein HslJ
MRDASEAMVIRISTKLAAALLIAAALIASAGCSRATSSLDNTQWRLAEWTLSSLSASDFTITAEFADGKISGTSAVNSYSGPCRLGPGAAFSAGPLAGTMMASAEPSMNAAETAYLTLLGQARSYNVADGKLTLYDGGGNESLIYEAATK